MRSADALIKLSLMAALVSAMPGCASLDQLKKAAKQDQAPAEKKVTAKTTPAKTPALAAPSAAASTASTAVGAKPAAPAAPVIPPEPPINPATQRLFDDANRALKAGRTDDAERGYRYLIQSNPELGGPHANLGVIYRNAHKYAEAVDEFKHAIRLSPKQPVYQNQLGVTYRQMGQFDKARDAYEQAIALDANYAPAIINLGILCDMYLGDGQRALGLFSRYLALTPSGDATVRKWVTELKNRKPAAAAAPAQKEKS